MTDLTVPAHPLSAACYYASLGWPVFPCNTRKQPKTRSGFKDATTDQDEIRTHWTDNPDDTIAIATGPELGSQLLIIDADSYKPAGTPELDALIAKHGLPRTFTVKTGQGGRQYYFTTAEGHQSRTDVLPNVDVRCKGGYVIAPPSATIFGGYEIIDATPPAPPPEWLLSLLRKPQVKETGVVLASDVVYDPTALSAEEVTRLTAYADRAIAGELGKLREMRTQATPGGAGYRGLPWDQTVFQVACNLVEFANSPWIPLTETAAHGLLFTEAPRDPGFGDVAVQAKWDSARKIVGAKAREVPSNPLGGGFFIPTPGAVGGIIDPSAFFTKGEGLNASLLATAIMDLGPLAIEDNQDRAVWSYAGGLWQFAPNEVVDRCSLILGHRFRPNHVTNVQPIINRVLKETGAIISSAPIPEYVNCRNGMLHWATGTLYPHDPSFYSTVQLPVSWDPSATCPNFDVFVKEVMASDAVAYLWEVLGYMIYCGNPLQVAFLFHGNGANGKGTLIRVLTALLGAGNCSAVTLQDITEGKFEVASMVGKIANLAGDIDPAYMRSTAKLKAITGEDAIEVQRKFQHPFRFKCWATPLFSANEYWKSADTSLGYFRRWQVVGFPNTFDITPGLAESFEPELPGILRRAVAALSVLLSRGRFNEPESAVAEKRSFEQAADQVIEWLTEDPNVIVSDPGNVDTKTALPDAYRHYRNWCEGTGNQPVAAQKFKARLEQSGYQVIRSNGYRRVVGLLVSLDRRTPYSGVSLYSESSEN